MKALVGGLVHESSTFAAQVTGTVGLDGFVVADGSALLAAFEGTNTVPGGYLAACAELGVPVVPLLHARAEPAGPVSPEAYEILAGRLLDAAEQAAAGDEPYAVLLDLHGAGVIAPEESLELRLLRELRARLGGVRVAITLDLHGNLVDELADLADVIVGFHEYPHIDMAERARRAASALLAGRARTRITRLPMVLPPSPTDAGPAAELRDLARAAERAPGVLACSVFHGFPYADTPQAGSSVVTVGASADAVNARLAAWLWDERERFRTEPVTPEDVVAAAVSGPGPLVVGDASDNPGGGGCGDGTHLLRAVLDAGLRACFATVHDPAAVRAAIAAGVGAELDLDLGGRHGVFSGPPLRVRATVRAITDGRIVQRSMRAGQEADFGPSVRLTVGRADVIVSTNRLQVLDPEILLLHGVRVADHELVAVKSAHHFRSGFAGVGARFAVADTAGLTSRQVERIPHSGPSARLWPMNPAALPERSAYE
ncbi:M81 family metallopeptidase [Acrocarpospora catenulata]|uniref:M81 family metallopeptidase n=1 Tax=Acrocarpospora catenulata TaxID=2836182 RepID=UPI001BD98D2C|nr:M81 family metallopeptidase [Acrocarpospora catenulata]